MKNAILFLFIIVSASVKAQTLKELLYSGKLKADSNSVVRKTDDLRSKIDTSTQKKVAVVDNSKAAVVNTAATTNAIPVAGKPDSQQTSTPSATAVVTIATKDTTAIVAPLAAPPVEVKAPVKSNSKIWRDYSEALVNSLKGDALRNKKIKKETYYFTVEYVIEPDGKATIGNITSDPDNGVLTGEVKTRITNDPPQFSPVLDSNNKPIKVKKRSSFMVTKD
jgi:hypothetical protein